MQGEEAEEHWPEPQRSGATPTSISAALTSPLRQRGGQGRLEDPSDLLAQATNSGSISTLRVWPVDSESDQQRPAFAVCLRRHGSHVGSVQPAWGRCLANSKPGHPSPDSTWLLLTSAYSPSGHGLVAVGRDATCLAHSISEIIAFDLHVEPMSLARTFHINIIERDGHCLTDTDRGVGVAPYLFESSWRSSSHRATLAAASPPSCPAQAPCPTSKCAGDTRELRGGPVRSKNAIGSGDFW
ncbi:hypothetical protein D4764_11G0006080 [Takifugu flavidus]|uniref:Uncharacterized protein n=1 Tax=Takifugu flavidus TaxID=433684 RepID=A0A5C6PJI3_9TELE|nr:hypothetical protein D4764_11G0006080 [Takifugu flavidus]